MSLAELIQPRYNPKAAYLPIFRNSQLHKLLYIKDLGGG